MSHVHSVTSSSDSGSSLSSDDEPKRRPSKEKRNLKAGSGSHLDSNGESDEEVDRLHRIIREKTKELDEEKLTAKKLKQLVKNLRKENKVLHKQVKEKEEPANSDSDNPPWERRKLESQLLEKEKLLQEKNFHIEQLLNDCHLLEKDNKACHDEIQTLTRQFNECTSQLHQAAENYSLLEQKFKDRVVFLEEENKKIQLQLNECQLQKLRNEENLDRISEAVDATVDKCREIIAGKEKIIEELESKLLVYASSGASDKDEEIRRLRSELQAASQDLEQSARLLEQIQESASPKRDQQGKRAISRNILKKLRKYDQLKNNLKETEEMLTERDKQVAEIKKLLNRYESGTYGLGEAIKELRESREQLTIRDRQIEELVQQLNLLETKAEDILMENDELREKLDMSPRKIDIPMKRKTLMQQLEDCQQEIRDLTCRNMELGLQNQCLKRESRHNRPLAAEDSEPDGTTKSVAETDPTGDILQDYRNACSEVIILRKGLVEILASVREQDGRSDVKIQSPILERLIAVLNCERLFGHYDAYADFMSELSAVQGENRVLRERVRELKASAEPIPAQKTLTNAIDQAVQTCDEKTASIVDVATDPIFTEVDVDKPVLVDEPVQRRPMAVQVSDSIDLGAQVERYEEKLSDLEQQLNRVKLQLQMLNDKYQQEKVDWDRKTIEWIDELSVKNKRLEELENELKEQEALVKELETAQQNQKPGSNCDSLGSEDFDTKRVMEKDMFTLKIRLDHKEQMLKRYQQLLDELRVEQLNTIEKHSQEVLNLQDTILDQQRSLYRVEQTQREVAASAASSRVVVRHLETEVGAVRQLHNQVIELKNQLDVVHKQAAQWKQAAEALSREKRLLKESLESDHQLIVDQLKNHWESSQMEAKELRDQIANMKRELLEERYDKQRSTLLHVLVTKLKTELDKKEKQMEFLKHVAQELHSRISCDDKSSSSDEHPLPEQQDNEVVVRLEETISSLKQENLQLEKAMNNQKKQLQNNQTEIQSWRTKFDEQSKLVEKIQNEKSNITRQMVSLRSRLTRLSGERTASQNHSEDICRLLKRIKELESQLAIFHQAEKPVCDEAQQQKNLKFDEWKERKKMQVTIDGLKVKLRTMQNRFEDDERYKENLRKTINRLVSEKRALEEKLKFKANDNERMHRLIEENTQWRNRFEMLEHRLREMSDDEGSTDRHRLQISVLQDRLRKQDEQIAQLQSQTSHTSTRHAAKAAIEQLHRENVALKILSQRVLVVGPKMIENIQRLDNLVHMDVRPSERGSERRVSIQEGPPMPDIRRTVRNLHQLVSKLLDCT